MPNDDAISPAGLSCPVCGARQPWSEACRRCKCDLALVRRVAEAGWLCRRRALELLRSGRPGEALRQAEEAYVVRPGADAGRLLAVCRLLCGHWPAAIATARRWIGPPRGPAPPGGEAQADAGA